jgi:dihydrofolate reductase
MTEHPDKYKNLKNPGLVEFTSESPVKLTDRFRSKGYEQCLVVGGPHITTSFSKGQLRDELWLTIEPKIFGTGGCRFH